MAEVLINLSNDPAHKSAFLSVKRDQVLSAAKASTERYKQGKVLGPLDGVPVAVKGMRFLILLYISHVWLSHYNTYIHLDR